MTTVLENPILFVIYNETTYEIFPDGVVWGDNDDIPELIFKIRDVYVEAVKE